MILLLKIVVMIPTPLLRMVNHRQSSRHHRRYRITEGAEEIQMRRIAGYMFGFMSQQAPKGVKSVSGR